MSRMSHEEFVGYCVNLITTCRCVLEQGKRSPQRVSWLLSRFLDPLDLRQAITELRDKDPVMHDKILGIQVRHTGGYSHEGDYVNWEGAERTWTEVKRKLHLFAEQKGGQVVDPPQISIPLLREARRSLAEFGDRSTN